MQNVSPCTKKNLFSTKELILWKVKLIFYSFKRLAHAKLKLCFYLGTRDPVLIIILGHARRQLVGACAT